MWQFYKGIILRALSNTPTLVSSNWVAVFASVAILVGTFIIRVRQQQSYTEAVTWQQKLRAMRDHWKRNLRDSFVVTIIVWSLLFTVSLAKTLYSGHRQISASAKTALEERDTAWNERDQLKRKVDEQEQEIKRLENAPPKIPTSAKANKPNAIVEQHSRGNNSPNVGNITQAPGSIAQLGGQGNQATVVNLGPPKLIITDDQEAQITSFLKTNGITSGDVSIFVDEPTVETQQVGNHLQRALQNAGVRVGKTEGRLMPVENTPVYPGISFDITPETLKLADALGQALIVAKVINSPVHAVPYPHGETLNIVVRRP